MKYNGNLIITKENQNDFKNITEVKGYIEIESGVKFEAPVLTTCGNVYIYQEGKFEAPALTTCGNVYIEKEGKFEASALTTCGDVHIEKEGKFEASALTTCGDVRIYQEGKFEASFTKYLNYKSIDGTMFVVESERSSKGIKILTGYIFKGVKEKTIQKKHCYVAEKDNFYAHGETVKSAINDLQFKIVSEKLKKDPITEDTQFTVKYYRLLTGACDMGCRQWLEQNKIPFRIENGQTVELKPMNAKDLKKLLDKSRPYGYDKFKSMLTF